MKDNVKNKVIKKGLQALEKLAEKKANSECYGIIYEPKIPKKLKKTLCLMLVSVLTTVTLFGGNASTFWARDTEIDYEYESWNTYVTSPYNKKDTDYVSLYIFQDETYRWAVTLYRADSGYGSVRLDGYNCVTQISGTGSNVLMRNGYRDFTITTIGESERYATFRVLMDYDNQNVTTTYSGYVEVLN